MLRISAVKTVAAWRQCREESYQKVRKVIKNVFPHFLLLSSTISSFLDNVLHFFLLIPPFFLCCQSCSNISPHNIFFYNFPHFSSQLSSFFPHNFPHFISQLSSFFHTTFVIFPHNFSHFSSQLNTFFLIFPHNFPHLTSQLS